MFKKHRKHSHHSRHHHQKKSKGVLDTTGRRYGDMMSGDSSKLSEELKVDVNSTIFAGTKTKHLYNEDTAAILVDMKMNKDLQPDKQQTGTAAVSNDEDAALRINDEQTDNVDDTEEAKTIPLVEEPTVEQVDAIYRTNSIQKINDEEPPEKEECVVKCLYYAIQCCECTIQ